MLRLSRFLCNYVAIISRTLAARRGFDSFFSDDVSVLPVRNTRGSGTPAHKYILTRALSQALTHTPADAHSSCPASAANMESKPDTSDKSQKQRRVLQAPSPPLDSNPAFAARKTNKQANKQTNKQPPPPHTNNHVTSVQTRMRGDLWRNTSGEILTFTSANRAQVRPLEAHVSPRAACARSRVCARRAVGRPARALPSPRAD